MVFRIRIVIIDFYTAKPVKYFDPLYSVFRARDVVQVPIIRIFGTSDQGHKCCLNVHGFFPYFSIKRADLQDSYSIQTFAHELDRHVNLKLGRPAQTQHVYLIEQIWSTDFYGFHNEPELFYRIHFYSDHSQKTAFSILRSGTFWNRSFDVYEAHFNYVSQFFVNYNLFGMSYICLDKVWPRQPFDKTILGDDYAGRDYPLEKHTNCQIEMDCLISSITNVKNLSNYSNDLNPGLSLIWCEEINRRLQQNLDVEELFKNIIDLSSRNVKKTNLELEFFSVLRQFLFHQNTGHSFVNLCPQEYFSLPRQSQSHFSLANSLDNDQHKRSQDADICQGLTTQEVIDLIKNSQNLLIDEELLQEFIELENEYEDENEDLYDQDDQEKGVDEMDYKNVSKTKTSGTQLLTDISLSFDERKFNLNSESIIKTPPPHSIAVGTFNTIEPRTGSESRLSNEINLFSEDDKYELNELISPEIENECLTNEANLFKSSEIDLEVNLFDSSDVTLTGDQLEVNCDVADNANHNSASSQLFVSSGKMSNLTCPENSSIFSFYLSESQPEASFSSSADTQKTKRRRLSAPSIMQADSNEFRRCSTPFSDQKATCSQNGEFVDQIRNLIANASQSDETTHKYQYLTVMSMELFALSQNQIKPDPNLDPIKILFYQLHQDYPLDSNGEKARGGDVTGAILLESDVDTLDLSFDTNTISATNRQQKKKKDHLFQRLFVQDGHVVLKTVRSELQLIECFLQAVYDHEPEILIGFEIETSSWGYLMARANQLGMDCTRAFSRLSSIAFDTEQSRFDKRWQRLQKVCPPPSELTNNYLRKRTANRSLHNHKAGNVWQQIDQYKQNLENGCESQPEESQNDQLEKEIEDFFSLNYVSPCYMNFTGRIMLNLWRIIRKEISLTNYSFESVYLHVLNKRLPVYTCKQLSKWFNSNSESNKRRVVDYFLVRTIGNIELVNKMNIVGRNSELSRVFGIQFSDVISKGTQFRVESLLYRSTIKRIRWSENEKCQSFMLLSCDHKKRARQHDPFMIPFVMDPFPGFYCDPVAVLDFQSLYPSIMIAYNYCYSTCLGHLKSLSDAMADQFGCSSLAIDKQLIGKHFNDITISPNGLVFLKKHVRKGTLCGILEELLNSRIMVKDSIKLYSKQQPRDEKLLQLLDARQLGLKLIANVTYGYTAAGFSGRMPCVDLADAIISKGRETLMEAMRLVQNNHAELGCEVIYGDTDSIFVRFENTSVPEAFDKAAILCQRITHSNPKPVKIKLEKVYSRCILMTKKRYAGYCYEHADDLKPKIECKGIETVRRDSIPLVKRVLDRGLRILFTNTQTNVNCLADQLKAYFEYQVIDILRNHRSKLHEFVFAREYRGQFGYRTGHLLPSIVIANHLVNKYGENCRPFSKQRVPYVICQPDVDKQPLAKCARLPLDVLNSSSLRLNCEYYIKSVLIPPLQRVFGHLGVNINTWYQQIPGKSKYLTVGNVNCRTGTVSNYVQMSECSVCNGKITNDHCTLDHVNAICTLPLCNDCQQMPESTTVCLTERLRRIEMDAVHSYSKCNRCQKSDGNLVSCQAVHCYNLFKFAHDRLSACKYDSVIRQLDQLACSHIQSIKSSKWSIHQHHHQHGCHTNSN